MTAADQTPATDSERVEQIRARWYEHHIDPTARDARVLLLTEVDVPWLLAEHERLTALLAEQAATIERVRAVHEHEVAYDDDVPEGEDEQVPADYEKHYCSEDGETWPCTTARALGSQRTEGQG